MANRRTRRLATLFLLSVVFHLLQETSAQDVQSAVVRKLTLTADGDVDVAELQARLALRTGEILDPDKVRHSIQNLYETGDFHYVECTSRPGENGLWLDFRLVLKRYFARLSLQGPKRVRDLADALSRLFPLGEPYSQTREDRFLVEAERFLQNHGYFQPRLTSEAHFDPLRRGVHLALDVQVGEPTKVGTVTLEGDMVFPDTRIRKTMKLKPGVVYSRELLLQAIARLKAFYVDHEYLSPQVFIDGIELRDEDDLVDLTFRVNSGPVVEVFVEGATVSRRKLKEILPIYREASLDDELLEEGSELLKAHLLERGYSSANIDFAVDQDPSAQKTSLVYSVDLGQQLVVEDISVTGLKEFSPKELRELMAQSRPGIKVGSFFTVLGLDAALAHVVEAYRQRGYAQAQVAGTDLIISDKGTVNLDLELREGESWTVRTIAFAGNAEIPAADLLRQMSSRVDQPFYEQRLNVDERALLEYYQSLGYPRSTVRSSWGRDGTAVNLLFEVGEGRQYSIDHIAILGNTRTHHSSVSKNIGFRVGDRLAVKKLFEGEQKLYNTAAFDQVRIRLGDPQLNDKHQTVIVGLRETRPRALNFGFGYQEFEGPRGLFELSFLNVGGKLRTAQIRAKGSLVNQSIQLNIREPRPLNRNFESFATLQASRKEEVSFTERRFGISLQALRDLTRNKAVIMRYDFERVNVFDAKVALDEIPRVSRPLSLSSVSAAFLNDTRDNPFDPQRGAFHTLNLQITVPILRSDARFVKFFSQSQYYRSLTGKIQLAEAFRIGLARSFSADLQLPISERFFAGGATTLRGFANDEAGPRDLETDQPVGGNALLINNLELRFPIVSRFGGVLFYDTGNVFSRVQSIRLPDFTHSVGVGLKVQTPIGPIRFDYGFNLRPSLGRAGQQFFISFGPLF